MLEPAQGLFSLPDLLCPLCGFDYTHLERVDVATRPDGEDGRIASCAVHVGGRVELDVDVPHGQAGEGRRDRAALRFWCEGCDSGFAIVYTQHKGQTMVDLVPVETKSHYVSE